MPQPTKHDVHVNRLLTNISTAYMQDIGEFIADRVFPIVPVDKQSDLYPVYNKNDFFRSDAVTERVDGRESSGSGYRVSTDSYMCHTYATHKDIGPQAVANADSPFNLDRDATIFTTHQMLLRRENLFMDTYFQAGVWGRDMTGVAAGPGPDEFIQFDDFADSNPRRVIRDACLTVKSQTGYRPNTMVVSERIYEVMLEHPDLIDLFKYTREGLLTSEQLGRIFDIPRIFVTGAVEATNVEGAAEAYDFVAPDTMWIGYVAPRPSIMMPSAGYTFAWRGLLGANAYGGRIVRIPTPLLGINSYRVENEMSFDHKVVGADLGVLFSNVLS